MVEGEKRFFARRWQWLHRIGYACTIIVLVEILWAGTLVTVKWWQYRERATEMRAHSRVHRGLLFDDPEAINLSSGALSRLGALQSVAVLGPDSVRLANDPAMSDLSYALALRRRGQKAEGVAVIFKRLPEGGEQRLIYHFQIPKAEFDQVMAQFDRVIEGYQGGDRLCTDGVQYAFERRNGTQVTSGTSMSSCDATYERATMILLDFAQRFTPLPKTLL